MEHVEQPPLFIESAADGQRLREQIRSERDQTKRYYAKLVADIKETLRAADKALAGMPPPRVNDGRV